MRRLLRRPLPWSLLALTLLAGAAYAQSAWTHKWGIDFWNVADMQRCVEREKVFDKELTGRQAQTLRRIAIKDKVVTDLIEGRLTLAAAVDRFRTILEETPVVLAQLRFHNPGASDDELLSLNVVHYADLILQRAETANRQDVLQGLSDEMCMYLAELGQ